MKIENLSILAKTAGIVCAVVALLIAVLIASSYTLVISRFAQLEEDDTKVEVQRAVNEIANTLKRIELVTKDWAPWDETYHFVEGDNPAYIEDNLQEATFSNLQIHFYLLFDTQSRLVYQQFYDLREDEKINPDKETSAAIAMASPLMLHFGKDVQAHASGLLLTASGKPLFVSAAPIVTSTFEGPIRGTLVMGYYLDEAEIKRMGEATRLSIRIHSARDVQQKAPAFAGMGKNTSPTEVTVLAVDERKVEGYTTLADILGQPAVVVAVSLERKIMQQGIGLLKQFSLAIILLGCVFVVILLTLLNRLVLRKLVRVAKEVDQIAYEENHSLRLTVQSSDEIGHLTGRINSMLDALENYRGRQAAHEQYLKELLDSINCGVMVIDAENRTVIDINRAGALLIDRPVEEIVGRRCHQFICPREENHCPVLDHGEAVDLSIRTVLRADSCEIPVMKSVTKVERDGRQYLIESFIDISLLTSAQKELKESEAKYRLFFEEDLTSNFISTPDGRIIDCNPASAQMLGYKSVAQTKEANMRDHYLSTEDRDALLEHLQREKRLIRHEWSLRHCSGEPIHCVGNLVGVFDDLGQLTQIRAYIFDETKRVQLEKEILQAQKMEAIGTMAGGIAHDFNNILAGIMGYTEIAMRLIKDAQDTRLHQYLQNIMTASDRARGLIRKMLTFSRQAGTDFRPIRLLPTVQDVIQLIRAALPATIAIEQRFDSRATIMADQIQIHQVVMNLCTNAGHAMKNNGGVLAIALEDVTLGTAFTSRYSGMTPGEYVRLRVSDTGKGIPAHLLGRIFDPFFTTKKKGEGTGLGLSMVHGIVNSMNGLITVVSEPDKGTRFDIYLPRIEDEEESIALEHQSAPTGNEHIVFVDDEPFLVDIGTEILRSLGYRVTSFTESTEALAYLKNESNQVDLVVTDMTMPKLTGLELAKSLQQQTEPPAIIICTGHTEGLSLQEVAPFGVKDFLEKPMNENKLALAVRSVLDGQKARVSMIQSQAGLQYQ